jgi:hypothetical protein
MLEIDDERNHGRLHATNYYFSLILTKIGKRTLSDFVYAVMNLGSLKLEVFRIAE